MAVVYNCLRTCASKVYTPLALHAVSSTAGPVRGAIGVAAPDRRSQGSCGDGTSGYSFRCRWGLWDWLRCPGRAAVQCASGGLPPGKVGPLPWELSTAGLLDVRLDRCTSRCQLFALRALESFASFYVGIGYLPSPTEKAGELDRSRNATTLKVSWRGRLVWPRAPAC